jgi:Tol biopolymer transport system component
MPRTPLIPMAVLVVVAAASLIEARPAAAAANGDLAFVTGRGGPSLKVWTMNPDGSGAAEFTTGPPGSVDVDPSWEPPAGGRLAFARRTADDETYDLMIKPVGSPATKLTDDIGLASSDRQPAWSSAGQVAFTRTIRANNTAHVYKVSEGGGTPVQLTSTPAPGFDASPAWNASGTQLAFVSDRTGFPQIWIMDGSGGAQTQLTSDTTCFVSNPAWSPSGTVLAYERLCPGQSSDIYTIDVITRVSSPLIAGPEHEHQPVWAPVGDRIAFTRYGGDGNKDLWAVDADGTSNPQNLTAGIPNLDMSADWESTGTPRPVETAPASFSEPASQPSAGKAKAPKRRKQKERRKFKVIKGVRFVRMRAGRSEVYVLKISPLLKPRLDVALSNNLLPGHERTSRMAKRHGAVAAINGDFGTPSGRPSHTFAEDGDLKQVSFAVSENFAISRDERTTFFQRPLETASVIETDTWSADRWNFGAPPFNDVAVFTPAGGALEVPPPNACAARLVPLGGFALTGDQRTVVRDHRVETVACSPIPMAVNGAVVVAARPGSDGGILVNSLTLGETVRLGWSVGFTGVVDTVGGRPLLVKDGVRVATACPQSICKRHPRTGIGVTATGRILLVVVDGRRRDSKGVTLKKFANIMLGLHATQALNLDGGGSSTMWVRGKGKKVMNEPSDGRQRKVSSAILVRQGADPGEAIGAARLTEQPPAPPPGRDRAGEAAALDPASTGGLAEALAEGAFGAPQPLPPELRRALRLFRSSR